MVIENARLLLCGSALAIALGLGTALTVSQASASGGGNKSDAGASQSDAQAQDMTTCPKGQIWDAKHKKCVRLRSEALPDDEMTHYAYALAKADRYDEALETLDLLQNQDTAEALNYRGYATRKLGRTDEGIGYYLRSVALDPHYAQVREYLGEAYVIKGRVELAKDQLATIKTICGTDCEPYRDLAEAIEKAPSL